MSHWTRREFLKAVSAGSAVAASPFAALAQPAMIRRAIPSSGERIAALGLGTWITFDVAPGGGQQPACNQVMRGLFQEGGQMVDSSPMYGQAQAVIGEGLNSLPVELASQCFSATKVWVPGADFGRQQMEQALRLWGLERFDLIHVHNMVDWRSHLEWLQEWKATGRVRYIGISTSHGRRHAEMERVIRDEPFDVVQFTYNVDDRAAERNLLPLAAEHGKAVVINRPFQTGALFRRVGDAPLPGFATEIDARNWAQFFLKFILGHPAVTCVIPATRQPLHLAENMAALRGPLPDADMREEMARYFERVA